MWTFRLYEICKYEKFGRNPFLHRLGINHKANGSNNRVLRGGNYNNNSNNASNRNNNNPTNSNNNYGCRAAL